MTTRRLLLQGLGTVALGGFAARPAFAQQTLPVIVILAHGTAAGFQQNEYWFREGLFKGGIEVGRHVQIAHAFSEGRADAIGALAADLVARKVALIMSTGDAATQAAKKATSTISVVFQVGSDPVQQGLVASLNRPGGNLTGLTNLNVELGQKRVELLHEILAKDHGIALLVQPVSSFTPGAIRDAPAAAGLLGRELHVIEVRTAAEIDTAAARAAALGRVGLLVSADAFFNNNNRRLAALALQHRLPAVYSNREFAFAGGLVGYGTDVKDIYRMQGLYAARVLKGGKPPTCPSSRRLASR